MRPTVGICGLRASLVVVAVFSGGVRAQPDLQSSDLAARFTGNGDLASLRDLNGTAYAADGGMPLFEAVLQGDDGHWSKSTSRDANSCRVETDAAGTQTTLRFVFADFQVKGATVTVVASADTASESLTFHAETAVPPGFYFTEITCPYLKLEPTLGDDTSDDLLLLPIVDGILLNDEAIRNQKKLVARYPGQTSMQWMSWYDEARGLGVSMKDAQGQPKWIGYELQDDGALHLKWSLLYAKQYVPSLRTPTVEIVRTQGEWQQMARRYRGWALRQKWVTNRKQNGTDEQVPWLRRLDMGLEFNCRPQGCGQWWVKPKDVGEYVRSHKDGLGAKDVLLITRNFEKHGCYVMPEALPFVPALRTACEEAHREGAHTYAMTAMLKWATRREEFRTDHYHILPYEGQAYYDANGGPEATAINWDGKPIVRDGSATWDPDHARLCVGTLYAEKYVTTFSEELAKAGIDVLEWDQMNGGGATWCYSKEHGHPIGSGKWQTDATHRLFERSREVGRQHNPDFCLSLEDPCEYWMDVVDIPTKRPVFRCTWPGAGKGSITVPAFAFVYGSVCPLIDIDFFTPPNWSLADVPPARREAMSGWSRRTSASGIESFAQQSALDNNQYAAARVDVASSFLYGSVPIIEVPPWMHQWGYAGTDSYLMPEAKHIDPDHRRLLANLLATTTGPGRDFLDFGEMTAVANVIIDPFVALETRGEQKVVKKLPRVLACAYRLDDREAWFVANVDESALAVDLGEIMAKGEPEAELRSAWLNGVQLPTVPSLAKPYELTALSVLMLRS